MYQLPRLVGLTGAAGSGKDSLADYLVENYDYHKYSFASPIKHALCAMFGWRYEWWEDREFKETVNPDIGFSPRQLAQTLGTEWGRRTLTVDFWVRRAQLEWKRLNEINDETYGRLPMMVIPDVRFDNEARWIYDAGGIVIHIVRPDAEPVTPHVSEVGISPRYVDAVIANDGTLSELKMSGRNALLTLGTYHYMNRTREGRRVLTQPVT